MLNGLDLFSGIGGLSIALQEWVSPIAYCEIDPYCQGILLNKMAQKLVLLAPICDDIRHMDGSTFGNSIDIIYGGFPCQDISIAGLGKGLAGERSGLFFEIVRLAKEIKPKFIFLENVPAITSRGGLRVVSEIAEMGYDCRWCVISAASIGALHKRERWFLLAHADQKCKSGLSIGKKKEQPCPRDGSKDVADSESQQSGGIFEPKPQPHPFDESNGNCEAAWWKAEPNVGGTFDGLSAWLDENKMMLIKSHKCIMSYVKHLGQNGKTSEENRTETLRTLRSNIQQEIDRESSRGFLGISATKVLLSYLCKLEEKSQTLDNISQQSEEIQEGILRSVWAQEKFARSSYRSKHSKQFDREHPDTLQTLSRFLAHDAEEAWTSYRWENAKPILSQWKPGWEDGIERVADGIPQRVDRLRALGNAVVPQQAKEAFKILMGLK